MKQNQAAVPERFPERKQGEAREQAAAMVGANPHYVTDAKKIEQNAGRAVAEKVPLESIEPLTLLGQQLCREIARYESRMNRVALRLQGKGTNPEA